LELDTRWVSKVGAQAPFTLRNVLLQDMDVYVPIAQASKMHVTPFPGTLIPEFPAMLDLEITKEMRQGVFPKQLERNLANVINATKAPPTLLLVHGYCSDVNPWSKYASDFSDAAFFLEPLSSLSHDKFSQKVIQFADNQGMTKWSGIGHSQGGMVLAHMHNYYFTGIDHSAAGRKIQSVGAPYQGNSGAGTAANLIKMFGFGCGENFDLTTDGSNLWLVGIAPETRKEVFYYTTTYKQGQFFWRLL